MNKLTFDEIRERGLLLYEYKRGSHAYGLNTKDSDEDYGGIFMASADQLLGLGFDYQEQVQNETNDIVWYELNKFMRLLLSSNPTILESLFVPDDCVIYEHPIMTEIKKHRDKFITKKCFKSLGSYAIAQISKCRGLNKKIVNPVTERLGVLDFCYTFFRQGSTKITNWLEYRGLKQQYCGVVNIPNMHDVYGCYYDWGNFFLNENITLDDLEKAFLDKDRTETTEIITKLKECDNDDEKSRLNEHLSRIHMHNMVRFIIETYGLRSDRMDSELTLISLTKWYIQQSPIGYKGIVGVDGQSNELRLSSVSKREKPICYISYNQTGYQKHCIDYKNYKDWEKHRNPVRYESNLNKNYDAKNVMHSMRLINMCIEIARGEGFKVDRRGIDRDFLLDVKNHKYEYEDVISILDRKKLEMDEAIERSTLPDEIDIEFVNNMLLKIRKNQLGL